MRVMRNLLLQIKKLIVKSKFQKMNKTKTVAIFGLITMIIVIIGFVLLFTRKQKVEDGIVKSYWKNPKTETPAAA